MSECKQDPQAQRQAATVTLDLLVAVEAEKSHSQRALAARLGVALGLTNALVKRCIKKGLVKVREAPARRYAYYLTPKGFKEKGRLTAEYLSVSLDFFRQARGEYGEIVEFCQNRGWNSIALCGSGELAEIAYLAASDAGIEIKAVVDKGKNEESFHGVSVVQELPPLLDDGLDAVIVTSTDQPQEIFNSLSEVMLSERIITPSFLHVSRKDNG